MPTGLGGDSPPAGAVEVERVGPLAEPSDRLVDFALTSPTAPGAFEELALEVSGWAVGRRSRVRAIELSCEGELVRELAVDIPRANVDPGPQQGPTCGFYGVIGALRLPPHFALTLAARLEDGARVPLAQVVGRRESAGGEAGAGLPRGAFVSTPTGRTGTTWMVHLLGQHPAVVAHPPFGVEPRPASYWLEVAIALSEPGSYQRVLRPNLDRERWWLGEWTDADRQPIEDDAMRRYLGHRRSRQIAGWARERIADFYAVLGERQGKSDSAVFVEKAPMGRLRMELLADLLPGTREIAMFRDPRDTLCSILAYKAQNERAALVSPDPGTDDGYLQEVARSFRGLLRECRERPGQTLVVRYEDVIRAPAATLTRILDHLDLDRSAETVDAMLAAAAADSQRLERHRTSGGVAERSIGRWRRDMAPALRSRTAKIFDDVLADLGYVEAKGVAIAEATAGMSAAGPTTNGSEPPAEPRACEPEGALRGVVRAVDVRRWRHVYSVGGPPEEDAAAERDAWSELGALLARPGPDRVAVYLEADGRAVTDSYDAVVERPRLTRAIGWAFAPLGWRPIPLWGRIRRVLGRWKRLARRPWSARRKRPSRSGEPLGYLLAEPDEATLALFSAVHPVTGDQLLTTMPTEPDELGYQDPARLGYLVAAAPITGALGPRGAALPWIHRPGAERRIWRRAARGALSHPAESRVPRDALRVAGWALLPRESVSRVDILINESLVGQARLGIQRLKLDAAANPEAPTAGFDLRVPPSILPDDVDRVTLEAVAVGTRGSRLTLAPPEPIELTRPVAVLSEEEERESARLRADFEARFRVASSTAGRAAGAGTISSGDPIHVVAFAHSLDTGGAQRTLLEQLDRLQRGGGFTASVIAPRGGPLQRRFADAEIDVHLSGPLLKAGVTEYERRIGEVAAHLRAVGADAVLANTLGCFIAIDAATRLDLPSAWIIHESYELPVWWQMMQADAPDAYVRSRCIHALRHVDAAIFPATATRLLFEPYLERARTATAPCGVEFAEIDAYRERARVDEVRESLGYGRETTLVLSLGIVEPRKGQAVLARAWSAIHGRHPDARLAIVGATHTPYCTGVRRYIQAARLDRSCRLVAATADPFPWHAAADVFVLSSDVESAPVVLAEAMAFDTPVIATDVFGIPELITNRRDGFLCEPNNVDDLARTLDRVLRMDPGQLRAVAERGNRRAREHHDPERFAATLARTLQELVEKRRRVAVEA